MFPAKENYESSEGLEYAMIYKFKTYILFYFSDCYASQH